MEPRELTSSGVAARRLVPRVAGRLNAVLTSRVTHSLLLLAAAVGNGLMLGALNYLHELVAPLADLTQALAAQQLSQR